MGRRNERAIAVSIALEGHNGWNRDPYAAGVVPAWNERFPKLPIVADGRMETGNTRAGRGTTAFDLFRLVDGYRSDFLSIKTETIEPSGRFPSKLSLSTGNVKTLGALIDGINDGASLATVVFASRNGVDGPEQDGFALFLDLGDLIRRGIPTAPAGGWGRGKAPPIYFKWSSARKCGGKSKRVAREGLEFPHQDDQGRKWVAADRVCYRELVVSLPALGISKYNWIPMHVSNLARFCENQDWRGMAWGDLAWGDLIR